MSVDRSRRFALPGIQDLSKDQDEALACKLEGQYLIIGGPGTGKSVVALLRARRLAADEKNYRTLVYNHLLDGSNRHLFGSDQALKAGTWEKWFRDMYKHIFKEPTPTIPQENPEAYRPIDWQAVEKNSGIQERFQARLNGSHFLIIDEGQDMPPQFYHTLVKWGAENFYVVADQNQQIHPDKCCSRQDIENALAINTSDVLELKTNYRNTRPIALLARQSKARFAQHQASRHVPGTLDV